MLEIPAVVSRDDLTLSDTPIGEGGQAKVWRIEEYPRILFKEYSTKVAPNAALLRDLVACRQEMDAPDRAMLDESTAWPLATVTNGDDDTVGVLIGEAPDRFMLSERETPRPAELQYLVLRERAEQLGVTMPAPSARLDIIHHLALVMDLFARHEIVHGDISHRNVLWSAKPGPAVFVLDCDGASLRGEPSALPTVTTPHWTDPRVVEGTIAQPDIDSDRLGLALAFYRTFFQRAGNFSNGKIDLEIPETPSIPESVKSLCRAGLTNAAPRASAEDWLALDKVNKTEIGSDPELPAQDQSGPVAPGRFELATDNQPKRVVSNAAGGGLPVDLLPASAPPTASGPANQTAAPIGADATQAAGPPSMADVNQPPPGTVRSDSDRTISASVILTVFLVCLAVGVAVGFLGGQLLT